MSLMVASMVERDEGEDPRAIVGSLEDGLRMMVVCRRKETVWEPLYGIEYRSQGSTGTIVLPDCFSLSDAALEALDEAWIEQEKA